MEWEPNFIRHFNQISFRIQSNCVRALTSIISIIAYNVKNAPLFLQEDVYSLFTFETGHKQLTGISKLLNPLLKAMVAPEAVGQ